MDCDHKYLAYIKAPGIKTNNTMFISPIHSGTVYLYLYSPISSASTYHYITDIEDLAAIYGGRIPIIIMPMIIGVPIKNMLTYPEIICKLNYVLDVDTINTLCNHNTQELHINEAPIIYDNICILLWYTKDINITYINAVIAKYINADVIIIGEYSSNDIVGNVINVININIYCHMAAFLQGLNFIYNKNLKYNYVYKLYYHSDFVINYEMLHIKNLSKDVTGYPAIKYDYLDNNLVYKILNDLKITGYNINALYPNIKTLATKYITFDQINRKTKDWGILSKKTNKSYIPSSIFIIKFDKIPFECIDCYSDVITKLNISQCTINAINKILSVFEN